MRYANKISLVAALLLLAQVAHSQIAITGIQHSLNPENFKDFCVGSIDLTAEGTAEPFTYKWSNGETTQDIQKLCVGQYTVTVTNRFGCSWVLDAYINNCANNTLPPLELKDYKVTPLSATGAKDGAINLVVQGGAGEIYYKWVKDGANDVYAATKDINNLPAGKYCVTISGGCGRPIEKCFKIVDCVTHDFGSSVVQKACEGDCVDKLCQGCGEWACGGRIVLTPSAGSEISYSWNTGATTKIVEKLKKGTYTVTITDKAAGCTTVKTFTIGTTNYTISTNNQHATKCVTTLTCDGKLTIAEEDATWSYLLQADQVQGGTQLNCYEIKECIITKFKGEPKKLGAATKKDDFERCIGEIYCDFPNTNVFPKEQLMRTVLGNEEILKDGQNCLDETRCTINWPDGTSSSQTNKGIPNYTHCHRDCPVLSGKCCKEFKYCKDDANPVLIEVGLYNDGARPVEYNDCKNLPTCPPGLWDPNEDRSLQTGKVGSLVLQTSPNPFYDMLLCSYGQAQIGSELDIVLLNAVGVVVHNQKAVCEAVEGNIIIQFGNLLPSGVYRLLVKGGGHEFFYQKNLVHINR